MSRRARLAVVALGLLLALGARLRLVAQRTTLHPPWLLVYEAVGQDLLLLPRPGEGGGTRLGCLALPRWAVRVGEANDRLLLLDPTKTAPALLSIDLEAMRRVAAGTAQCDEAHPPLVRVPLHAGKVPYRGLVVDDMIYVSYFGEPLVEVYRARGARLSYQRDLDFSGEHLGLSDVALVGDRLAVAASGFRCYGASCPDGHFAPPRLFLVDRASGAMSTATPANLNSAGLYRHVDGATFVICAGDYAGGYGSVQRVAPDGTLGREIRLPPGSAAGSARPLDARDFLVLQMSGEHVFVVDAAAQSLRRVLRFDGARFVEAPADAPLPDRAAADFQDVVADLGQPDRFFFVDSRGERLVQARWHGADASFAVERVQPLGDGRFLVSPNWAIWLR